MVIEIVTSWQPKFGDFRRQNPQQKRRQKGSFCTNAKAVALTPLGRPQRGE